MTETSKGIVKSEDDFEIYKMTLAQRLSSPAASTFLVTAMVVEVPVSTSSLWDAMSRMRNWLDERGCTPILFSTASDEPGTVLIRVEFAAAADALAFKASFGPAEPQAPAAAA